MPLEYAPIALTVLAAALVGALVWLNEDARQEVATRALKAENSLRELRRANKHLQSSENEKSRMLSFASHELKAPMAVIKGYAELIGDGSLGPVPDKVRDMATKILSSTQKAVALADDFLNVSRVERKVTAARPARTDISAIVTETVTEITPLAKAKGLELDGPHCSGDCWAYVDPESFRLVPENLLENAIKYTDAGTIRVTLTHTEKYVVLEVSDTGRGIRRELLPSLFREFQRDPSVEKSVEGSGLGLAIAKQIVKVHHGRIRASSDGPDTGSTFTVEIPRATA